MKSEHVVIALFLLAFVVSLCYAPPYFYDIVGPFEPEDTESSISVTQGDTRLITVYYNDVWHDLPIEDATVTINTTHSEILEVISALPDEARTGYYIITLQGKSSGSTTLTLILSKSGYDPQSYVVEVIVYPPPIPPGPRQLYGLPALLFVIICAIYYKKRMIAIEGSTGARTVVCRNVEYDLPHQPLEVASMEGHISSIAKKPSGESAVEPSEPSIDSINEDTTNEDNI